MNNSEELMVIIENDIGEEYEVFRTVLCSPYIVKYARDFLGIRNIDSFDLEELRNFAEKINMPRKDIVSAYLAMKSKK